jgi:phosphogluconate dehydratase
MDGYRKHALLDDAGKLAHTPVAAVSYDETVLRPTANPFRPDGGLRALSGNLGRAVIKVSAVPAERAVIEAPAVVFDEQDEIKAAFERGELDRDFVAVVRFQGPRANGMPELHKLTPVLGVLQDRGFKVALVTDGRMSGASGKVPAAIHLTPEAACGGAIGKIQNGDIVRLDALAGTLDVKVDNATFSTRAQANAEGLAAHHSGLGRELFSLFRDSVGAADAGASVFC